ncbi:hypothetical protein WMF31_17530 [Sorangium sp. So ce1036]|uniref:hypothetical protein n=1 Tax=Sorangium sp. So ce1036 TaxID=3133328 RepID=UPI003F0998D8
MSESPVPASVSRSPSPGDGTSPVGRGATSARARRGALLVAAALAAGACGGKVVVDGVAPLEGEGAGGSAPAGGGGAFPPGAPPASPSGAGVGDDLGEGGAPPIPPLVATEHHVPFGTPAPVAIPPGTLGFTAIARRDTPSPSFEPVGIKEIRDPEGTPLAADYSIPGTLAFFYNQGIGTAAVPQTGTTASVPLVPGIYWVTVGDGTSEDPDLLAHLTVWRRQTLDGRFHGGIIDINAFIAGDAHPAEYVQQALRTAYQGYVGLRVGRITPHSLGREWERIDEENLPHVFEQTAGAPGRPALNVIVVSQLDGALLGASGATPSAPAVALEHGTRLSGLVVLLYGNPVIDTIILRHELGHLAGLFHTTEIQPGFGDPLDDTAQCDDVNRHMESCPDFSNIMFPTGGDFSGKITPQQTTVMQASAFYRGIVEEGGGAADPLPVDPATPASGPSSAPPAGGAPPRGPAPAPGRGAWAAALPPRAATLLAGHFCAHSVAAGVDYFALLRAAGGAGVDPLLAVGRDPGAPAHVRARALAAVGRAAAPPAGALAELEALAADPRLPRVARLGAIQGVASASPAAARALAARLIADPDEVVERMAIHAAR